MKPRDFTRTSPGTLVEVSAPLWGNGHAFVPDPLPPDVELDQELVWAIERAALSLGKLNGLSGRLRNPGLLVRPFLSREALSSSRIEGTRADYGQFVMAEAVEGTTDADPDLQEVSNYLKTLYTGWGKPPGRPFSPGFLMELHRQLMTGVRGENKRPGQLRERNVLIGSASDTFATARFVPPPYEQVRPLVEGLCEFSERNVSVSPLVRIALIHYQFETIHPFEDGNGRLGRLIMPLLLGYWGLLERPLLYVSEFLEEHRDEYIDRLNKVSVKGEWIAWVRFVMTAIEFQALDAITRGQALIDLGEAWRRQYQGTRWVNVPPLVDLLVEQPAVTANFVARRLDISPTSARRNLEVLVSDGIVSQVPGSDRNKVFVAPKIMKIMDQDLRP